MSGWLKDLRQGSRIVARTPGFSAIAVVALALGIGLTTTMFTIVNAALYKGLPFADSHQLVLVSRTNLSAGEDRMGVSIHDFLDWSEQQPQAFQSMAAYYSGTVNIRGTERAERLSGSFVTASLFPLLQVQPVLGRGIQEGDDRPGAEPVAVLGYELWRDRYNLDPGVIGQSLFANGEPHTIVGVMPEDFLFPQADQIWLAHRQDPLALERGGGTTLSVLARLRPAATVDQATLELSQVAERLAVEFPESNEGIGVVIGSITDDQIGDEARQLLLAMLGATFLILIVACANVANLLLARAAARTREVAVRTALGASRRRVIRQMLSESLVLSAIGSVLGLALAWVAVGAFVAAIEQSDPPYWLDFSFDPRVFLFVTGLTVAGALASGLIPAIKATGADINGVLKDQARGSSGMKIGRLSRGLVVLEISLSAGLLVGAGLMIKSVTKLSRLDYGFATESVYTARVGLFPTEYPEVGDRLAFFRDVQERLRAMPGVQGAALATGLPGLGTGGRYIAIQGQSYATDQDYPVARSNIITPGYFEAFDVDLLKGRNFTAQDDSAGMAVAIVNELFADRFFPDEEPLGKQLRVGRGDSEEPWLTIVGVVPDLYMGGIGNTQNPQAPGYYTPLAQEDARFMSIAVRTAGDPNQLAPGIRDAVASVDADVPIYWPRTMKTSLDQNTWFFRVFGVLFMAFGVAALFLASVGLYGVMSFSVNQRTTEVGIRMAMGAEPQHVIRMILRQGVGQVGLGLILGAGVALAVGQGVQIILFDVQPRDPMIFASIAVLLMTTGLIATLIPAARATRVDPIVAFRAE